MGGPRTLLISRLDKHVMAGPVGAEGAPGRWRAVPYRTDEFDGVLLGCGEATRPEPVTLRLGPAGPHRIWLGVYAPFSQGHVRVRLTRDTCCRMLATPAYGTIDPPVIHELLWREADLSGQALMLEGAYYRGSPLAGALAFVRLEPIERIDTRPRPEVWRPMAITNDGCGVFRAMPHRRPEDLLEGLDRIPDDSSMRILLWGNGNGDSCNYPTKVGSPMFQDWADPFPGDVAAVGVPNVRRWQESGWDSLRLVREFSRARGWELHVYIRRSPARIPRRSCCGPSSSTRTRNGGAWTATGTRSIA